MNIYLIKSFYTIFLTLFISTFACSQDQSIPLWENGNIPNQKETDEKEIEEEKSIIIVRNVQNPALEVYLPSKQTATGQGVIICPGGGYHVLAYDWEGTDIAKWLNSQGIAAFVLKYRLPVSKSLIVPHEAPLMDAKRAIRTVRFNAEKWNVSPDKIGIMGFSAGGHLASTLATRFEDHQNPTDSIDKVNARPDFSILVYPRITMDTTYGKSSSRTALLGGTPEKELVDYYSNELHVSTSTPPTFLVHCADDEGTPPINSLLFYQALQKHKIPSELHIYPEGGHGFGLAKDKSRLSSWTDLLSSWLESLN